MQRHLIILDVDQPNLSTLYSQALTTIRELGGEIIRKIEDLAIEFTLDEGRGFDPTGKKYHFISGQVPKQPLDTSTIQHPETIRLIQDWYRCEGLLPTLPPHIDGGRPRASIEERPPLQRYQVN